MKKIIALAAGLCLLASLTIGGSIAYLTDTAADDNVMTLGNVDIDQMEYERVVVGDGFWVAGKPDKYGYTPDELQDFTQSKPLMPAVFTEGEIKWDDRNGSEEASGEKSHQQSWAQVGAPGSNQLFDDSVKNVQDKFVFVKNTGNSKAYVRTIFAFEQGDIPDDKLKDVIMLNRNKDNWHWDTPIYGVEIGGNKYMIGAVTYMGPKSSPDGVLVPGATTYASLLQVYMKPEAGNKEVQAIDGNKNGKYDIYVVSQAVQVAGFDNRDADDLTNAKTALNAGFGAITKDNHPWANGMPETEENPSMPTTPTVDVTDKTVADAKQENYDVFDVYYSGISGTKEDTLVTVNDAAGFENINVTILSGDAIVAENTSEVIYIENCQFNLEDGAHLLNLKNCNGNQIFLVDVYVNGIKINTGNVEKYINCDGSSTYHIGSII